MKRRSPRNEPSTGRATCQIGCSSPPALSRINRNGNGAFPSGHAASVAYADAVNDLALLKAEARFAALPVSAKLKEPESKERKFEDVVKSAEQAAVLVLVYRVIPYCCFTTFTASRRKPVTFWIAPPGQATVTSSTRLAAPRPKVTGSSDCDK